MIYPHVFDALQKHRRKYNIHCEMKYARCVWQTKWHTNKPGKSVLWSEICFVTILLVSFHLPICSVSIKHDVNCGVPLRTRCICPYTVWYTNLESSGHWVSCSQHGTVVLTFSLVQRRREPPIRSALVLWLSVQSFRWFRLFQTFFSLGTHDMAPSRRVVRCHERVWDGVLRRLFNQDGRPTLSEIRMARLKVSFGTVCSYRITRLLFANHTRSVRRLP